MPEVKPLDEPRTAPCVVVQGEAPMLHSGLLFRLDDEELFLHLAWHLQLKVEQPPKRGAWIVPNLKRAQRLAVATLAGLIRSKNRNGAIPFGFALTGVSIDSNGHINLGSSTGLTCASFLVVLFEASRVPLLLPDSWDLRSTARRRQDEAAQERLASMLERDGHTKQANRVRAEIGATRIRSEEVAAASGLLRRPADYAAAEEAGRAVLSRLSALNLGQFAPRW